MAFIPLDPTDDNVATFLDSIGTFPFSFVAINDPGAYKNENIVFRAEEDIDSLYDFLLIYFVEDMETDLSDYEKTRILDFPEVELQKGSFLQISPRKAKTLPPLTSKPPPSIKNSIRASLLLSGAYLIAPMS